MTEFIKISEGLKPIHQKQMPLFEKEYFPPGSKRIEISRLYADGSLYFLTKDKEKKDEEKWGAQLNVSEVGMKKLEILLKECCALENDRTDGNVMGLTVWRILCANQVVEIVITLIPASKHTIFKQIQELVNHNILQGKAL